MKKLFYIAASLVLAACSGTVDPGDINGGNVLDEYQAPYTLSVDKTEVEASGSDYVTFSLKDANGRDLLLDMNALQRVNIVSAEGQRVNRMETKTSFVANGTYSFTATYKGRESENTVDVVAKNRRLYEVYHKNVAIYKATATWCGPCAFMTRALGGLNEDTKNHSVELCWHYQDDLAINSPGTIYDCGTVLANYYGGGGVPVVVLDLVTAVSEKSTSILEAEIWKLRAQYPATCGLKLASSMNSSTRMVDISVEMTSSSGGEYDLGFALLLNDQVIPTGTNDGGKYSHIVCGTTGNYCMYSTSIQKVEKNASIEFSQSVEAPTNDMSKLSVVAFALVKNGDAARIDNIVEAKVGTAKDYVYNE